MNIGIILSCILVFSFVTLITQTFASCAFNKDWPQAPCLDTPPYTNEEQKQAWGPYYNYKGSEWMEEKKLEMIHALETGTFREWADQPKDYSHWNVYEYFSIFEGFDYENKETLPPLKQFKAGIPLDEIKCRESLILVQKYNGLPACVKYDSAVKLNSRNWVKSFWGGASGEEKTEEIFMEKPLSYWKSLNFEELRKYNSNLDGDKFYYDLGELLAKEFFKNELVKQNIVNANDDITVYTGFANLPDPPIIYYNTAINAKNGSTFIMHTSVNGNIIGKYFEIERLVFEPRILQAIADKKPVPFINKFGESPTIYVVTEDDEDKLVPYQAIIDFNKTDSVIFVNNSPNSVRIQEVGENKFEDIPKDSWKTKSIAPGQTLTLKFNSTGHYEFNVKKITNFLFGYLEHHSSGEIVVFTENMTDYTFAEGLLMGRVFVQDAPRQEIPWQSMGAGNNRGLEIGIVSSVRDIIPNADEYYLAKAKSLIPFDVRVIIE